MKTKQARAWALGVVALGATWCAGLARAAVVTHSVDHVFTVADVQGGFDGSTYGTGGAVQDTTIICGLPGGVPCPANAAQPFVDKDGTTLYPVDSEFAFYTVDFLGGFPKVRDYDYAEGWVANLVDPATGAVIGVKASSPETPDFKTPGRMGTRCPGLGSGAAVKCDTEHFTVMEHVLSCYETVPYFFADPVTGVQAVQANPLDPTLYFDCANAGLDNSLNILTDGVPGTVLGDTDGDGIPDTADVQAGETALPWQMYPSESIITHDIALGDDYSLTVKDDGKVLYRWGSLHNRPTDLRLYARLPLPQEWKDNPGQAFPVYKAELHVTHWVTNNPNDQLRPEDMENEAAKGRLPEYRETQPGIWESTKDCYEGDGDFIPAGTLFKNAAFAVDPANPAANPQAISADLVYGLTNAWYTSTDRDPFEWAYLTGTGAVVGSPVPNPALGTLLSGPRWRLKSNKFGQDIPGLEIPAVPCTPVPVERENLKYTVGETTTTVINLLDWAGTSPLATSAGWMDASQNPGAVIDGDVEPATGVSINGLPLTQDFDLAVYVKGDQKPTAVYSARLILEYEGAQVATDYDVALTDLAVPSTAVKNGTYTVSATVINNGPAAASGTVALTNSLGASYGGTFADLAAGQAQTFQWIWQAPAARATVNWAAAASAPEDTDASNNTRTASTRVR
ncbi:MAG: hypothetical protein AB1578_15615 [Thermodesulfobacteriota bacterium]